MGRQIRFKIPTQDGKTQEDYQSIIYGLPEIKVICFKC